MTADHPVRRWLARVCSPTTMARVVDPTLADMRFERGRPVWLGYLSLARALARHGIVSLPDRARRAWHEDESAIPKAVAACAVAALAATLALVGAAFGSFAPQHIGALRGIVLLTPQAMAVAVPASLLVGIPLAFRRSRDRRRILARSLAIAGVTVAATLVLMIAVPEANQAFRVEASGQANIPRGASELTFRGLRDRIEVLELTPGGRVAARKLRYLYQVRLALVCAPLPLGLFAAAIAARRPGRAASLAIGSLTLLGHVYLLFGLDAGAALLVARLPALPGGPVAWLPTIALTGLALWMWRATPQPAR